MTAALERRGTVHVGNRYVDVVLCAVLGNDADGTQILR